MDATENQHGENLWAIDGRGHDLKMAAESTSSSSVHLWVCDTEKEVHVLCHVTSSEKQESKWREVDGSMSEVIGGSNGTVCGISDNELMIRTNISYSDPLGKKWCNTSLNEFKQLVVGRDYIAVWLPNDKILLGNVHLVRNRDFCPIKWGEITDSTPPQLAKMTMSHNNTLYGVTKGGEVYGCYGINEPMKTLKWELITKPPPIVKRGFLSSLFKRSNALFHDIGCNTHGIWCYSKDNHEIWQLVIHSKNKTSWSRYKLPSSTSQLISMTCNPSLPVIYAISIDSITLYQIEVSGPVLMNVTELPFHGCGDIVIATISCCLVTNDKEDTPPPALYPKLPKETDLCCENGTCTYCLTRNTLAHISLPMTETSNKSIAGTKRHRESIDNEFEYLSPCHQATPPYKRKRYTRYSLTHRLIKDIPVIVVPPTNVMEVSNVCIS